MVCRECFSNSMSESTQRKIEYDTTFKDIYFHNSKTSQGFIFKSFHTLGGRHYEHNMSFPAKCKTVAFVNFVMSTISGTISQKLIMNRFREHIKCWLWGLIWRKVQVILFPKMTHLPILVKKKGCATFLCLLSPNFIQKIRKLWTNPHREALPADGRSWI